MFCENCGQEVKEGAKFCTRCGRKIINPGVPDRKLDKDSLYSEKSYSNKAYSDKLHSNKPYNSKSHKRKSHKGPVIGIVAAAVLLVAAIAGGLFIWNVSVGKEEKRVVTDFLESYQKLDEEKCAEYLYEHNVYSEKQAFSQLQKSMAETMKFRITGVKKEDGYTVVKVKISNIDFETVMETVLDKNITQEENVETEIEKIIAGGEVKNKEYNCEVNVYQVENERKIEMTESLSNALLGGFPEYIHSLIQEGER